MRSWRPFCCGLPGAIRSGTTPALITLTESCDSPPAPQEANGGPLSERSRYGRPNSRNAASPRRFDGVLREPGYSADHAVRRVRHNGEIRWRGHTIYISAALTGEPIGLIENNDGGWTVSYGPIMLGIIAHGEDHLRKPQDRACGLVDNAARCPQGPQSQQQHPL